MPQDFPLASTISNCVSALVSAIAFAVSSYSLKSSKRAEQNAIVYQITERLYEMDKVNIASPDIQVCLKQNIDLATPADWKAKLSPQLYYQMKAYVYMWLNLIDEIVSTVDEDEKLKAVLEFPKWERYFLLHMRHPLFKGVAREDMEIFGVKFKTWFEAHSPEIAKPLSALEKDMF